MSDISKKLHTQIISGDTLDRIVRNAFRYGYTEGLHSYLGHDMLEVRAIRNARRTIANEERKLSLWT